MAIRCRFAYRQGSRRASAACPISDPRPPSSSSLHDRARSSRPCRHCPPARRTRACWPRASSACAASTVADDGSPGGRPPSGSTRRPPSARDLEHDAFAGCAPSSTPPRPPGSGQVAADRADHPRRGPGAAGRARRPGLRRRRPQPCGCATGVVQTFLAEALPALPAGRVPRRARHDRAAASRLPAAARRGRSTWSRARSAAVESAAMTGLHHCGGGDWAAIAGQRPRRSCRCPSTRRSSAWPATWRRSSTRAAGSRGARCPPIDRSASDRGPLLARARRRCGASWCRPGCNPTPAAHPGHRHAGVRAGPPRRGPGRAGPAAGRRVAERVHAQAVATRLAVGA